MHFPVQKSMQFKIVISVRFPFGFSVFLCVVWGQPERTLTSLKCIATPLFNLLCEYI